MAASVADATAVTPKGTKRLLASGLSTFLIEDKPAFINVPRNLPKNLPNFTIFDN